MRYCAVIPAAGSGSRMGAAVPKVLLKPAVSAQDTAPTILEITVAVFTSDPRCQRVVVAASGENIPQFEEILAQHRSVHVVAGGKSRQESVMLGLLALERGSCLDGGMPVLVHDAARCCLSLELVSRVLDGVAQHGAATAAVPVVDSLCRASEGLVSGYVDRDSAWSIQTPQGFIGTEILEAHRRAAAEGVEALDDAALVAKSRPVAIVVGDRLNIKITQPDDLRVARAALALQD